MPRAPPRRQCGLVLTRWHWPRRVLCFSCLLLPLHRYRRRDVASLMPSSENAPPWGIIGVGRAVFSLAAASAPPPPLPLLEPPPPPARSTPLGRIHCHRRFRRHFRQWCCQQGEEGDTAISRALWICQRPPNALHSGLAPLMWRGLHTPKPAPTSEAALTRSMRRTPTYRRTPRPGGGSGGSVRSAESPVCETPAQQAPGSTPLRGSGAAHGYGTPCRRNVQYCTSCATFPLSF